MNQTALHRASPVASHSCAVGILLNQNKFETIKSFGRFLFIVFFLSFQLFSNAQSTAPYDSSKVQQRNFSSSSLNVYKNDKDFQYEKEPVQRESWWDRFWDWFWNKYEDIMSTQSGRTTMKIIYWLLGIAAVAFFIMKVSKMNRLNLFAASPQGKTTFAIEEENIHEIAFEEAIQNAVRDGDYRSAIRLMYLQNLKILTDKSLIAWQPNKTNRDYLRELIPVLQQPFRRITDVFEYAWYGHLTVTQEDFTELKEDITRFQKQL
jgi:hypothetical protein